MSTSTPPSPPSQTCPSPLPLTTRFSLPQSCTATLFLTTYNATTTIVSSPPPGARYSSSFSYASSFPTSDLSLYGLVAGLATSPPGLTSGGGGGGGPRFHDAGCYPERYPDLRVNWFLAHQQDGSSTPLRGGGGSDCALPTYYSPGICPSFWTGVDIGLVRPTPAPTTTTQGSSGPETGTGTEPDAETAATCCPAGFTVPPSLDDSVPVYCESSITSPTSVYAADAGTWTAIGSGIVRAAGVEVRWRAGDVPSLYGNNGGSSTTTGRDDDGSLSPGAKAGIGVGVGLGGLALATGVLGLVLRRRRRGRMAAAERRMRGKDRAEVVDEKEGGIGSGEEGLEGSGPRELEGGTVGPRLELPVEERRGEMDGQAKSVGETRATQDDREDGKNEGTSVHGDVAELE